MRQKRLCNHALCHVNGFQLIMDISPSDDHHDKTKQLRHAHDLVFQEVWLHFCPSFKWYVTLAPRMPAGILPIQILMLMSSWYPTLACGFAC